MNRKATGRKALGIGMSNESVGKKTMKRMTKMKDDIIRREE